MAAMVGPSRSAEEREGRADGGGSLGLGLRLRRENVGSVGVELRRKVMGERENVVVDAAIFAGE